MRNKIPHPPGLAKFTTLYLDFAKTMLEMTNKQYMDDGAEKLLIQEYQFSGDDYTTTARYSAAHEQFIPSPNNDAFPHSVARKCADAFYSSGLASGFRLSDNAGTPIENPSLEQVRPLIIHMYLDRPIRHLVRCYGRTSFSRRQVLAYLNRYIAHWKREAATEPELAPIYNFETEIQAIKLDGYVSIVRFSDEEKTRVMKTLRILEQAIEIRNYASAFQVVRLRPIDGSCDEKAKREIRAHARKALQCAITSLRLMKPEGIGAMGYIRFQGPAGYLGAGFGLLEDFDLPWSNMSIVRDRYVLDRADLPRFRRLYKMLSGNQFETWDRLELLLRQFNRSCQRKRDEDRILDYAICLESALLSGVSTELSYRLALRAGKLLRGQRNPKQTFEHMKCFYNIRSKIVHSNETLSNAATKNETNRVGLQPHEFMRSMDMLMRELLATIVERVSQEYSLERICKDLDAEIINAL